MGIRLRDQLMGVLPELRYEPTEKRIRARLGGETVIDSTAAMLVWEPRRVVPTYAVPTADVDADLVPVDGPGHGPVDSDVGIAAIGAPMLGERPVLDPSVPFAVRGTPGMERVLRARGSSREAAAFLPDDPALAGYVIVDFDAFDEWLEEDEPNVGHPRDPFHRIDIVHGSRHVRVEFEGRTLADSTRASLLFEPPLPVRYYLPREDVDLDALTPSTTRSTCAYKGHAAYWSFGDRADLAWTYPEPLREAAEIAGHVAFFNERVDLIVDGERLARPVTPWSRD